LGFLELFVLKLEASTGQKDGYTDVQYAMQPTLQGRSHNKTVLTEGTVYTLVLFL